MKIFFSFFFFFIILYGTLLFNACLSCFIWFFFFLFLFQLSYVFMYNYLKTSKNRIKGFGSRNLVSFLFWGILNSTKRINLLGAAHLPFRNLQLSPIFIQMNDTWKLNNPTVKIKPSQNTILLPLSFSLRRDFLPLVVSASLSLNHHWSTNNSMACNKDCFTASLPHWQLLELCIGSFHGGMFCEAL